MSEVSCVLVRLPDGDRSLTNAVEDVRGRRVVDRNGDEVGRVDGLVIDEADRLVRFLEVGSFERGSHLVPVDAIAGSDSEVVRLAPELMEVAGGPIFDPDALQERSYAAAVYGHYGYTPFWWPSNSATT